MLITAHAMLARLTLPELELADEEARRLADAIKKVTALYTKVELPPKFVAWWGLLMVTSEIYGERIAIWRMKRAQATQQRNPQQVQPAAIIARPPPTPEAEQKKAAPRYEDVPTEFGTARVRVQ